MFEEIHCEGDIYFGVFNEYYYMEAHEILDNTGWSNLVQYSFKIGP